MRERGSLGPVRRLVGATGLSRLGDAVRVFSLTLWVYARTDHSGPAVAALMLAQTLPVVVVGVAAGALVDRRSRQWLLTRAAGAECLTTGLLILAVATGNVIPAVALVAVGSALDTVETIAARTWLPFLVESARLDAANARWQITEQVAFLFGPAAAALMYASWGVEPALFFDAATFVALGAIAATIPLRVARIAAQQPDRDPEAALGPAQPVGRDDVAAGGVAVGLRYIAARPTLLLMMGSAALAALSAGVNNTVMIFFVTEVLRHRPELLATLPTVNGIAQIAAGGVVIGLAQRSSAQARLRTGAGMVVVGTLIVATAPSLSILVLGVVVTSLGNSPLNIGLMAFEQQTVAANMLGRIRGVQESLGAGAFTVGTILVGALVAVAGPRTLLLVSFGVCVLMWLCLEGGPIRSIRRAVTGTAPPFPRPTPTEPNRSIDPE